MTSVKRSIVLLQTSSRSTLHNGGRRAFRTSSSGVFVGHSRRTEVLDRQIGLAPIYKRSYATEQGLPTTQHSQPGSSFLFEVGDHDPATGKQRPIIWRHGSETGQPGRMEISRLWLRDHCQCHECVHPDTKQRQIDTFSDLNTDMQVVLGLVEGSDEFIIQWGDGHLSRYDTAWLHKAFGRASPAQQVHKDSPVFWDGKAFDQQRPSVSYGKIKDGNHAGLDEWVQQISAYGFGMIVDAPADPAVTEQVLARVGPIRNTHYGGFYDFTSDLSSKDTAYTSQELGVHNDTTYFNDPVGLQAFHIISHTDGEGGHTLLADGFRAAEELYRRDPAAYKTLSNTHIVAHSTGNEDVSIMSEPFTVLQHEPITGKLQRVKWNNDDRAAFTLQDMNQPGLIDEWYRSARLWNDILTEKDPSWWIEFPLQPGQILLFDNWRVLHGRTSFTGKRRMCGAYISRDDYISRLRLSQFGRERILREQIY